MGFAASLQGHQILAAVELEVRSIMKDTFFQVGNSFHIYVILNVMVTQEEN